MNESTSTQSKRLSSTRGGRASESSAHENEGSEEKLSSEYSDDEVSECVELRRERIVLEVCSICSSSCIVVERVGAEACGELAVRRVGGW